MNKSSIILILMVSVVVSVGCAKSDWIQQTLVTVDVTGTWRSTEGGLIELKLEQQGSKVSGSSRGLGPVTTKPETIDGTVAGDVFRFRQTSGVFQIQGEMTISGDEMSGWGEMRGSRDTRRNILLRRVDSSPPSRQ